jgi:hypothetical protein
MLGAVGSDLVKIGRGVNPEKRLSDCQVGSPLALVLLWKESVPDAKATEEDLHRHFKRYHTRGEWFRIPGDPVEEIKKAFRICFPETHDERMMRMFLNFSPETQRRIVREATVKGGESHTSPVPSRNPRKLSPESQQKLAWEILRMKRESEKGGKS